MGTLAEMGSRGRSLRFLGVCRWLCQTRVCCRPARSPANREGPQPRRKRAIPDYLTTPYGWAYLNRKNARLLDHDAVVTAILLGNHRRLRRAALAEITPGQRVLQAAHVYGCLIPELARRIGPEGRLDVVDLVPLQAALCRRKLRGSPIPGCGSPTRRSPARGSTTSSAASFSSTRSRMCRSALSSTLFLPASHRAARAVFIDYHAPSALASASPYLPLAFRPSGAVRRQPLAPRSAGVLPLRRRVPLGEDDVLRRRLSKDGGAPRLIQVKGSKPS